MPLRHWLPAFGSLLVITAAHAGADRFGVTFVPGTVARVQIEKAALPEGIALIDYAHNASHSVLLVRRIAPGRAEIHAALTDVWYVIDGSGTLVTGGKATDVKPTAPGELRGAGIAGGIAHHVGKGDIVDIPAGVPHWVSRIDGKELVYLTVKVVKPKR
jgi:mannose-6-phosphate isomerase-like protein (cupin superfamily)